MATVAQQRNIQLGVDTLVDDPWSLDEETQGLLALRDVNIELFENARKQYSDELPPLAQRCGDCAATLAEIETELE